MENQSLKEEIADFTGRDRQARILVRVIALYSFITISGVCLVFSLNPHATPAEMAVLKMGLGLALIWCAGFGLFTWRYGKRIAARMRAWNMPWQRKFILSCTVLALLEEAVTTTMTNLAPVLGVPIGQAYITHTANYFHLVLFHSVVIFVPWFFVWAWMLKRFDFRPLEIMILFGITGTLAETTLDSGALVNGMWIFVYGLMVYIPALALPRREGLRPPRFRHYIMAVFLPFPAIVFTAPMGIIHGLTGLEQYDFNVSPPS